MDVQRDEEGHILHEPLRNPPAPKGILKNKGDQPALAEHRMSADRNARWNEEELARIEQNKDYGFMKIDEPKTPYHAPEGEEQLSEHEDVPEFELENGEHPLPPHRHASVDDMQEKDWSSDDEEHTEEMKKFKAKRAAHYNEGMNIALARELLQKEMADETED